MNIKKNFIAILATLCVLLPSCNRELKSGVESDKSDSYSDVKNNDKKIYEYEEETYDAKDLAVFKVYDYINDMTRYYVLEEDKVETYGTYKEGSLKNQARLWFEGVLSEDVFEDAKVTKTEQTYYSLNAIMNNVFIYDIIVENEKLGIVAKNRRIIFTDWDNHLESMNGYWNVTQNGVSTKYTSFSKDENGEYIIDVDAIIIDKLELLEGKYTKEEVLEIEEELNNNNLEIVRKLI